MELSDSLPSLTISSSPSCKELGLDSDGLTAIPAVEDDEMTAGVVEDAMLTTPRDFEMRSSSASSHQSSMPKTQVTSMRSFWESRTRSNSVTSSGTKEAAESFQVLRRSSSATMQRRGTVDLIRREISRLQHQMDESLSIAQELAWKVHGPGAVVDSARSPASDSSPERGLDGEEEQDIALLKSYRSHARAVGKVHRQTLLLLMAHAGRIEESHNKSSASSGSRGFQATAPELHSPTPPKRLVRHPA